MGRDSCMAASLIHHHGHGHITLLATEMTSKDATVYNISIPYLICALAMSADFVPWESLKPRDAWLGEMILHSYDTL